MTQQPTHCGPRLETWRRVRADDPHSMDFWACLLEASTERIAQAMARVGDDGDAVAEHFRLQNMQAAAIRRRLGT